MFLQKLIRLTYKTLDFFILFVKAQDTFPNRASFIHFVVLKGEFCLRHFFAQLCFELARARVMFADSFQAALS